MFELLKSLVGQNFGSFKREKKKRKGGNYCKNDPNGKKSLEQWNPIYKQHVGRAIIVI